MTVEENAEKGYKILIWLLRLLVSISDAKKADQVKQLEKAVRASISPKLAPCAHSCLEDCTMLAREYTDFVLGSKKLNAGIETMRCFLNALCNSH